MSVPFEEGGGVELVEDHGDAGWNVEGDVDEGENNDGGGGVSLADVGGSLDVGEVVRFRQLEPCM